MNFEQMTQKLQQILIRALTICKDLSNPELSSEHLFKAFLEDSDIKQILNKLKADINKLNNILDKALDSLSQTSGQSEPTVNHYIFAVRCPYDCTFSLTDVYKSDKI